MTRLGFLLIVATAPGALGQSTAMDPVVATAPGLFEFHSGFWLDLHHQLYAQSRTRLGLEAGWPAVQRAQRDTAGLGARSAADRAAWAAALAYYDSVWARRNSTFDSALVNVENRLAAAGNAPTLGSSALDPTLVRRLESVAAIHRALWWPAHDRANRDWISAVMPRLSAHGNVIAKRLTDAFRSKWPAQPIRVDVVAFGKGGGAYTTYPWHTTMVSLDTAYWGDAGLEMLFHEATHAFEDSVGRALRAAAARHRVRVPDNLAHVLIFYTAPEATRERIPGYVGYARQQGLWLRGNFRPLLPVVRAEWQPYLDGRRSFEDAIDALVVAGNDPPPSVPGDLFDFRSNFWVNLHQFLHLASRARKGIDATREATALALNDTVGFAALSAKQRASWESAVAFYERTLANRDPVFTSALVYVNTRLAQLDTANSARGAGLDSALTAALESAAPAYRALWWPRHDAANRAWITGVTPMVAQHGDSAARWEARLFQSPWPAPARVDVSAYAGWAGAYTTEDPLHVTLSSLSSGNKDAYGFESLFHEVLHGMDSGLTDSLRAAFRAAGKQAPRDPDHPLIFYTAGEITRRLLGRSYVPYADRFNMWRVDYFEHMRPLIRMYWQPYLDGKISLSDALKGIASGW